MTTVQTWRCDPRRCSLVSDQAPGSHPNSLLRRVPDLYGKDAMRIAVAVILCLVWLFERFGASAHSWTDDLLLVVALCLLVIELLGDA